MGLAFIACLGVVGCGLALGVAFVIHSQLHDLDWLD